MGYHLLLSILVFSSLTSLCWSQLSITGYDEKDLDSEDRLVQLFKQWRERHGKTYGHEEEKEKRFSNFKRNLKYVVEKNSMKGSFTVGLNRFADLSNEEFRSKYLSRVKKPPRKNQSRLHQIQGRRRFSSCDAPSSLDWRKKGVVTPVKDQGDCGSCWAFSSTGAMEGINAISTGELISLSEQELVDCDTTNDGCEGGYMDYAFEWVISNGGINSESGYPYTGLDGTCNTTEEAKKVVSIDGYEDVEESESALLCATVNQPISVGIDGSSIDFQLYTGGVYDGDCSSNPDDIDHAVLVVGYGSEGDEEYWIVKNSWGTSWGIEGYIYIKKNTDLKYGVCAIYGMASYPTMESSSPSPQPSPAVPPPTPVTPPPPPPLPPTPVTPPPPPPLPPTPVIPPPPPPLPPTPVTPPPPPPLPPTPVTPPPPPPLPPTPVTPPPPPPLPPTPVTPPPSPPPPPSPWPTQCGDFSYCPADETCCCIFQFYNFCLIYGCCEYTDAVCCTGTDFCCPRDYPICDTWEGLCLKSPSDYLGVAAKKKKLAKHKLPWTQPRLDTSDKPTYHSLQWQRNPLAAAR